MLWWCPEYQRKRNENKKLQKPFKEEVEKVIGELLFQENIEEAKETIYNMWTKKIKETKKKINPYKRPDQPLEVNTREVPLKRQHLPTLTRTRTSKHDPSEQNTGHLLLFFPAGVTTLRRRQVSKDVI